MKKFLTHRVTLTILSIVFLSLAIWYIGPLIGYNRTTPLDRVGHRLTAIGSLSIAGLLFLVFRHIKSRQLNRKVLDTLSQSKDEQHTASAEELHVLQSDMQKAVETLKSRNFTNNGSKRFLYQLPWYVIIGPPGAGKTTLLANSELNFPLEETHGKHSVKGLGGTRNCDWWFTDDAVLLDTAGRYTTQDSRADVDQAAWLGFLKMLREKRSQRPINGVLLALSIEELVDADETQLEVTAKTLRNRIEELYQELGIRAPVYLMLTKCDLLAGFTEYFLDLDRSGRQQVWGHTFNKTEPPGEHAWHAPMAALSKRLLDHSIKRLHNEPSQRNRELIYGFTQQFNQIKDAVESLAEQLTRPSPLLQPVLFRGIYFTSATQTGSPFDRVIQTLSKNFGLNTAPQLQGNSEGKSYFIHRLLKDVIFAESGLAGTSHKAEKKHQYIQWSAAAAMVLVSITAVLLWTISFMQNRQLMAEVEQAGQGLHRSINELDTSSLDLVATNDVLNKARALTTLTAESGYTDGIMVKHAGLYQGEKIVDLAQIKYKELLIDALLPRLMVRLEHQMHAQNTNPEFLFEALKTYQMIGRREDFDSNAVIGWFNFDLDNQFDSELGDDTRLELKTHIATLFAERPQRLPRALDLTLIDQYQQIAANIPLEIRAYRRMRNQFVHSLNSYFQFSRHAGAGINTVLTREDDIPLDQSIPEFFTQKGYRDYFLEARTNISQSLANDTWVLGPHAAKSSQPRSVEALGESVTEQYFQDYIEHWDTLFRALSVRPVDGINEAAEQVALLSGTRSPLKAFLVQASEQTQLTRPLAESTENSTTETTREADLSTIIGGQTNITRPFTTTLDPVTEHFAELHTLTAGFQDNTSQLDQILQQLAELNTQLLPLTQTAGSTVDTQLNTELAVNIQRLTLDSRRLATPLSNVINALTNKVEDAVSGGFCNQLNNAWQTEVLPFYQRAIQARYPVNRGSSSDIALTDFGNFFGPDGVIQRFVASYLSGQVARTPGQWTWTGSESAVCLSPDTLKQLARADDILNTFFSDGSSLPAFRFDFVGEQSNIAADIDNLFINIGGAQARFFNSRVIGEESFQWPGETNSTQASLRVEPAIPGSVSGMSFSGPWAVLRLFDQGTRTARRDGLHIAYNFGGRNADIVLTSSSFNPLNSVALRNFRAPETL